MAYVFASLGDFGRLPSNCDDASREKYLFFGKLQDALKRKGYDLGTHGIDCKYGESTNKALKQFVDAESAAGRFAAEARKYLERLGLTAEEARQAAQKIGVWLAANPAQTRPFGAAPPTGTAGTPAGTTTGTGTGTSAGGVIRISAGPGVVSTGLKPPKPPGTTAPEEELPLPPGPEAPAGEAAVEPWWFRYRWHLIGGSAFLVLGTLIIVLATRK